MDCPEIDAIGAEDAYNIMSASTSQTPNKLDKDVNYENIEIRKSSYKGKWVGPLKPRIEKMADAGFVYVGPGDYVECYKCGITLHRWKKDDNPRVEHENYMKINMDKTDITSKCELYSEQSSKDSDKDIDQKECDKDSGHYSLSSRDCP